MSAATLQEGIRTAIVENLPEVREVIDAIPEYAAIPNRDSAVRKFRRDRDDLATAHLKAHAIDRQHAAKAHAQVLG